MLCWEQRPPLIQSLKKHPQKTPCARLSRILQVGKTLGGVYLSPDGRFVTYNKQKLNFKKNAYINQLWLRDTSTGTATCLSQWFDHYLFDAEMPDYIKPDMPKKKDEKVKKD